MRKIVFQLTALLFLIFLSSCEGKKRSGLGIDDGQKVYLQTNNGLYVAADRKKQNRLIANRKEAGDWETFTVEFLPGNKVALQTTGFTFVSCKAGKNNLLTAVPLSVDTTTVFSLIPVEGNRFVIKSDFVNKFVGIDSDTLLRADMNSIDRAATFTLKVVPEKPKSWFTFSQLVPLITGLLFIFVSLVLFQYRENKTISIVLLLSGGFFLRLFVVLLTPYLNLWDEQFHALVAKNMMDNPFVPMLFKNPVLPYDYRSWVSTHIWLHKQPLFLWQMALSMKIFGVNTFALRLPSLIMSTLVILFIYRMGKITINKTVGFYGALLFATANFAVEFVSGSISTDHNDIAFMFYVTASIWAWIEYEAAEESRKKYFIILIGLFAGAAVLVKWLTGLLVFSGWGVSIVFSNKRRRQWRQYVNLLISLIIAVAVFLPWQIYILNAFPLESHYEFAFNNRHFFVPVEGHGGGFFWHFNKLDKIYNVSGYFVLFSVILLFFRIKHLVYKTAIMTFVLLVYLFFGIAATKMIAFTFCVSFIVFLSFGVVLEWFFKLVVLNRQYLPKKIHSVIYTTIMVGIVAGFNLDIEKFQENHTMWKKNEESVFYDQIRSTAFIKSLSRKIDGVEDYVVFGCNYNIPFMFFTDVTAAYRQLPSIKTYQKLRKEGYKIAVIDNGMLPDYLVSDKNIVILKGNK